MDNFDGLSENEFKKLFNILKNLSDSEMDETFFNLGWLDKEKGQNLAVPKSKIREIQNGSGAGKSYVRGLLLESDLGEVAYLLAKKRKR